MRPDPLPHATVSSWLRAGLYLARPQGCYFKVSVPPVLPPSVTPGETRRAKCQPHEFQLQDAQEGVRPPRPSERVRA